MRVRAALAACGFLPLVAAAETNEFWPELEAYWRVAEGTQLVVRAATTRDEAGDRTDGELGLSLDYRQNPSIAYRIGYLRSFGAASTPGAPRRDEDRITADFSYRWKIGEAGMLTDRNRLEFRDQAGSSSQRYRNRLRYEHKTRLAGQELVPYANVELYYDTRYDAIARWRVELGSALVFAPHVELKPYVGRQIDTKPERQITNGFGLILLTYY